MSIRRTRLCMLIAVAALLLSACGLPFAGDSVAAVPPPAGATAATPTPAPTIPSMRERPDEADDEPRREAFTQLRAAMLGRTQWEANTATEREKRLRAAINLVASAGFNAVIVESVDRVQRVAFPDDRVAKPFDPLAIAIEEGALRGIAVHAHIETFAHPKRLMPVAEATNPQRYFQAPGDGGLLLQDGRAFLRPDVPENAASVLQEIESIVTRYPGLAGIYLDGAWYPAGLTELDEIAKDRWEGPGNPNRRAAGDWRRDQLTQFLAVATSRAMQVNPKLFVSVGVQGPARAVQLPTAPDGMRSAVHSHLQDPERWAREGVADFLVVLLGDSERAPAPGFVAVVEDSITRYHEARTVIALAAAAQGIDETALQHMDHVERSGALGLVVAGLPAIPSLEELDVVRKRIFAERKPVPQSGAWNPEKGIVLGKVSNAKGEPLADAVVRLSGVSRAVTTLGDGTFGFVNCQRGPAKLTVSFDGQRQRQEVAIEAAGVSLVDVRVDSESTREAGAYLHILSPDEATTSTSAAVVHLLARVRPGSTAVVNGEPVDVLPTGILAKDNIAVTTEGLRLQVQVRDPKGRETSRSLQIAKVAAESAGRRGGRGGARREATPQADGPPRMRIDRTTILPKGETRLAPGDVLDVRFTGTPNGRAQYQVGDGTPWIDMVEEGFPEIGRGTGDYSVKTPISAAAAEKFPGTFRVRLLDPVAKVLADGTVDESTRPDFRELRAADVVETRYTVGIYGNEHVRLVRTGEDGGQLVSGLHEVRLGGPYFAELPPGTLLRLDGRSGNHYRVRLLDTLACWIPIDQIENLSPTAPIPHLSFDNISVGGDDTKDIVTIPYGVAVPYRLTPRRLGPAGGWAIDVDFYGAHDAATWISHRPSARMIRQVSTEQIATDHLRVCIELDSPVLWGYRAEVKDRSLRITVRRTPAVEDLASPLKGLTIAVEAGHGGTNSGAVGATGIPEKDITRLATDELTAILEARGAKVVQCRRGDEEIALLKRRQRAEDANATLFISVHCNAAGNAKGYLASASGTSTYYKWHHSRDLADRIHSRLLSETGLGDFGNVGNFNYTPLRGTWMPSMLVETAFLSNPRDEAKLLDPAFRQKMMEAVVLGTEDFLRAAVKAERAAAASKAE